MTSVLIVDDHPIVLQGCRRVLQDHGMAPIFEARDTETGQHLARTHHPDVIIVDRDRPHLMPGPDPYSTLVYAARGSDVRATIVDGELLVDDFKPVRVDPARIAAEARAAARELAARAGL